MPFTITGEDLIEIFNVRLAPYLPSNLEKVDPHPSGIGLSYTFNYTGRENRPAEPERYWDDPKLAFPHNDEEAGRPEASEEEYELRERARLFMSEVYHQARIEWRNAAHVAALKTVIKDTGERWKTYQRAKQAVEDAFAYLRNSKAALEWPSAVSRLVDAQDTYLNAALAFDARAREIAELDDQHFHEDMLSHIEAFTAAGYPEAKDWHISSSCSYSKDRRGNWHRDTTAGKAQQQIEEQNNHVAKVSRLAGATTGTN